MNLLLDISCFVKVTAFPSGNLSLHEITSVFIRAYIAWPSFIGEVLLSRPYTFFIQDFRTHPINGSLLQVSVDFLHIHTYTQHNIPRKLEIKSEKLKITPKITHLT